ncbi:MAG: DAK2 domain-containing protein [Hyphomicrobiales bacterium]
MKREKIREFDGKQLYYSFLAGAQRLFENQSLINKINVFPVADADTGTNLASTLRSIVDTVIPSQNLKNTADAIADAALVGARGNSGIIFAQFLFGFSNELKSNHIKLDIKAFTEAILKAVRYAYEAISNPREGTMISVIKEWAEGLYTLRDKVDDFYKLLDNSFEYANVSLKKTKDQLEALAKANVVDAGAKGFVVFLEGMLDFLLSRNIRSLTGTRNVTKPLAEIESISHEVITFRYCTEAMLVGKEVNKEKIRKILDNYGDSVVVAGSNQKVRIHVHTDEPANLFTELSELANITFQKVDDMVLQNEVVSNRKHPIGIISDSTLDLPQELIEKHQIHVVPLSIHFGDTFFLDRVTLKPEQFYKMLDTHPIHPSTAQPTFKDFTNKLNYMSTIYDSMIGVMLGERMSGTYSNTKKAAKTIGLQTNKNISVVNSKNLTGGLGLQVLRVAEYIEQGYSHEEIVKQAQTWGDKTLMLAAATTTKYMVRGGRLSYSKGLVSRILGVRPIVKVDSFGKPQAFGKPLSVKSCQRMILKKINEFTKENKLWGYAITHANNEPLAKFFADEIKKITGMEPKFINQASPVLSAHVGPGVTSISLLPE